MFNKRLQYKVTLLVFGILLICGIVGSVIVLHLQRQAAVSQFEESTMTLAAMLRDSLERDMLLGDRQHIQQLVELTASRSPINEVDILSSEQRVYVSARASVIGEVRDDKEIIQVLSSGETVTRIQRRYENDYLFVIFPVLNKPACHGCHGSGLKILGAIEIGRDTGPLDDQIKEQSLIMLLIGGLTFAVIGGALAFMLRSAVVNPLSKLAASARRIAQGDLTTRVEFEREDEVGTLARTFNEMAKQVEQHALALEDSKKKLEQRVQERTQQLQQMAAIRGQLLERLISAQEEERRRVARELHDEAGQALSAIMLDLARAIDALPSEAADAREKLAQSRSLAAQTLAEIRKLIYDLRPEVLDQLGLVPALRSYVKSRLEAENIKVQLSFSGIKDRLPPRMETTLFRVIQEAITNIIRHSGASMVNTRVVIENSLVTATIEDNGRGFDVEAAFQSPESWGLRGIRERATVVGGKLNIASEPGKGTRIQFEIPREGV